MNKRSLAGCPTHSMQVQEGYRLPSTYCYIGLKSETFCDRMINFLELKFSTDVTVVCENQ